MVQMKFEIECAPEKTYHVTTYVHWWTQEANCLLCSLFVLLQTTLRMRNSQGESKGRDFCSRADDEVELFLTVSVLPSPLLVES